LLINEYDDDEKHVLKMSTVSPDDTSRETATPLTDGGNNNRMVQLSPFD